MPHGIKGSTPQATCHPEKKSAALGLCEACYQKKRREKEPEKFRRYSRRAHLKIKRNPNYLSKERDRGKRRRIQHREKLYKYSAKYRKNNRITLRENNKRYTAKAKKETLTHYGKSGKLQCCWKGCTVCDVDMLTLDHVNNDGAKHILPGHKKRLTGVSLYMWTRREGYPKGFQTLCGNHQLKKEFLRVRREKAKSHVKQ